MLKCCSSDVDTIYCGMMLVGVAVLTMMLRKMTWTALIDGIYLPSELLRVSTPFSAQPVSLFSPGSSHSHELLCQQCLAIPRISAIALGPFFISVHQPS
jgi:hypothetical protein